MALSVVLFILIPLVAGAISRSWLLRPRGSAWFEQVFLAVLEPVTPVGLLLTLVLLFSFQGEVILQNPLHIGLIAVPLVLQTVLIFALAYGWARA